MKHVLVAKLFAVLALGFSSLAFADQPSVECKPALGSADHVFIRIDRGLGMIFQDAWVHSLVDGKKFQSSHSVMVQNMSPPNEVDYRGDDFELRIDTWISGTPQFNVSYPARFRSGKHFSGVEVAASCEFRL